MIEDTVGRKKFVKWMERREHTQAAVAAIIGVTQGRVSQWITRQNKPDLESAAKIESATKGEVKATDWTKAA